MWEYGLFHFSLYFLAFNYLGLLYGLLFLVIFVKVGDMVLEEFGYSRLNSCDIGISYEDPGVYHNLAGYFILDKIEFEEFRDFLYNRAVKNIPRMRSKKVCKFGVHLWEDMGNKAGWNQISQIHQKFQDEKDITKYIEDWNNIEMDFEKPLWEFQVLEDYNKTESVLLVKVHHGFSDGGGFISLLSCLNDGDKKMKVDKAFPKLSFLAHTFYALMSPFFLIYFGFKQIGQGTDKNAAKIRELKQPDNHRSRFLAAKTRLPFDKLRKCYKRLCNEKQRVTFNDYMMGALSVSLNKWYESYGIKGAQDLQTFISINMRGLPKGLEDLKLENDSVGIKFPFPIRKDFKDAIRDTSKRFKELFTLTTIMCTKKAISIASYVPDFVNRMLTDSLARKIDLVFSNVPFSSEPCYIANKECKKVRVYSNVYFDQKLFFVATTYRGDLSLMLTANDNLTMDPQRLIDYIHDFLSEEVKVHGE